MACVDSIADQDYQQASAWKYGRYATMKVEAAMVGDAKLDDLDNPGAEKKANARLLLGMLGGKCRRERGSKRRNSF